MKLHVDRIRCVSSGLCAVLTPEVFDLDEEGKLIVLAENPPPNVHDDVQQAILSCPVQALSLTED